MARVLRVTLESTQMAAMSPRTWEAIGSTSRAQWADSGHQLLTRQQDGLESRRDLVGRPEERHLPLSPLSRPASCRRTPKRA